MEPLAIREEFWPLDPDPSPSQPLGYLEILSRSGRVQQRLTITEGTLRLGRAFDNDLVLDDPYVCPHHAEICAAEGGLLCRDLGSVNGLRLAAGGRAPGEIRLGSGESLRVGRTTLRFQAKDHPVPPALIDHFASSPLRIFERPLPLLALFAAAIGFLLLDFYLGSTEKFRGAALAREILGPVFVLLAWVTPWALVSRIAKARWYYWSHCGIASTALIAMGLLTAVTGYACFAFGADPLRPGLTAAGNFTLIAAVIFMHLHFATSAPPRRLAGVATLVSAALIGLVFFTQEVRDDDFDPRPSFETSLKPPAFRLAPGQTPQEFFQEGEKLREKIEEERLEKN